MINENQEPNRHRTIVISDETWASTLEQAALENKNASDLCHFLVRHYLNLETRPVYALPNDLVTHTRTIYMPDSIWAGLKHEKVLQKRSISELIEQLLRGYLGLQLGNRLDTQ